MGDQRITDEQKNDGATLTVSQEAAAMNDVSHEIGTWSQGHGFRDDWDLATGLDDLAEYLSKEARFNTDKLPAFGDISTTEFLTRAAEALRTNYLGMKLMLIVSESAEALETLRDHGAEGVLAGHGNFAEELADAHIRLFDLEHLMRSPVGDTIIAKMAVNEGRPHKHGRKA